MSTLAPLFEAWDEAHREFDIAFEGLLDDDVWTRPHARLLSVGELAGHVAIAQAIWAYGGGDAKPDLEHMPIKSPLLVPALRYYTANVDLPVSLGLTAAELLDEVRRIHDLAKQAMAAKDIDEPHPFWQTWGNLVQYQVFHVAYHTGQIYSVRHLLGHETEHN